jgi:hypothetical protein
MAGRGAAPAGLVRWTSHPGGAGAPPVPIMRPCQELADDRLACSKRYRRVRTGCGALTAKARPGADKSPPMTRREAPRVLRRMRATGLLFSARHPLIARGEKGANPRTRHAPRERIRLPVGRLRFAHPTIEGALALGPASHYFPEQVIHAALERAERDEGWRFGARRPLARLAPPSASSLDAPERPTARQRAGPGVQGMAIQTREDSIGLSVMLD